MSDFVFSSVSIIVATVTLLSIAACALFLWYQATRKVRLSLDENVNSTGHVWDEDLKELNNPLPRWWMGLFVITVVFALGYLYFFPGLGSYKGSAGWTSQGQYQAEKKAVEAKAAPLFKRFETMTVEQMAKDPKAHAMGERLFLNNCAQCHGSDAQGSKGFPNLTDHDWLYGGAPETIQTTITEGRNGMMPSMIAAIGGDDAARNVAQYVLSLSGRENDSLRAQLGRSIFRANCAMCHGPDGHGNQALGAPNLSDRTWLYGGNEKTIVETIRYGRNAHMPAHKTILTADQIRVLTSYVWGLSND